MSWGGKKLAMNCHVVYFCRSFFWDLGKDQISQIGWSEQQCYCLLIVADGDSGKNIVGGSGIQFSFDVVRDKISYFEIC